MKPIVIDEIPNPWAKPEAAVPPRKVVEDPDSDDEFEDASSELPPGMTEQVLQDSGATSGNPKMDRVDKVTTPLDYATLIISKLKSMSLAESKISSDPESYDEAYSYLCKMKPEKYIHKLSKWKYNRTGDQSPNKSGWYSLYPREIYRDFIKELLEEEKGGWAQTEIEKEAREWLRSLEKLKK